MENDQNIVSEVERMPQATNYSIQPKNNSGIKWLFMFVVLLILGGVGIYFFTKSSSEPIPTLKPEVETNYEEDLETVAPLATKTPQTVDKSEITIEVKNGTGISGEAAYLQTKLKTLGYLDITVANADAIDYQQTVVTFSSNLSTSIQAEIKKELGLLYKEVNTKTSSSQKSDIVIITGPRLSSTKVTPKPSPSVSASASPSAVPTSTP